MRVVTGVDKAARLANQSPEYACACFALSHLTAKPFGEVEKDFFFRFNRVKDEPVEGLPRKSFHVYGHDLQWKDLGEGIKLSDLDVPGKAMLDLCPGEGCEMHHVVAAVDGVAYDNEASDGLEDYICIGYWAVVREPSAITVRGLPPQFIKD